LRHKNRSRRIGLARALSKLGYCSRSQAEELIRAGRVRLNAKLHRDRETPVDSERDVIEVDGKRIQREEKIYLMMNKPRGVVTTASDEKGRETVYSVLHRSGDILPWVAPVGRLDKASEGLLLLTNDSEWGARIADPDNHLDKIYHVQINRVGDDELLRTIQNGVYSEDGDFLRASRCTLLRSGEKNSWVEITLDEGKNRQIRRIFALLGIDVLRLVRVAIGSLQLGELAKGHWRHLDSKEKNALDHVVRVKTKILSPQRPQKSTENC
jgi:23S rRNA pseudouridine2605 synthase